MERKNGRLAPAGSVDDKVGSGVFSSCVAWERMVQRRLFESAEGEIVEIGDRIGFCPQLDPAVGECMLTHAKQYGIIVQGFDLAPTLHNAQLVPAGCGERVVELLHNLLHPVHDAIQTNFLFDQAGPQ